ncbi:MAG: hypothetical protein B6I17_03675 [Tenericutes bacterium 4572_104]|nr:MAG: hypothetical protein B6I17_03675 [Tenericutes bacterium 4572_104]
MKSVVFLIHGFNSDRSSMSLIARGLGREYHPVTLDLSITYQTLDVAVKELGKEVLNHLRKNPKKKCHFIGHSTGGIIIRMLMKFEQIAKQTISAIFIAVPNNGNEIAEATQVLPKIINEIFKPLKQITKKEIYRQHLIKPKHILYAGIAGIKSWNSTNIFFNTQNDGVVSLKSAILKEMKDFRILPYDHLEITQHSITIKLINEFLKNKKFITILEEYKKMNIGEKFKFIVKENYINDLISNLTGNIDFKTVNAKIWWNILGEHEGWELQEHKITSHLRILNPGSVRKGWGKSSTVREAIDLIVSRIKIDEEVNNSTDDNETFSKIKKLKQLRDEDLITEEEFLIKKKELLANI